MEKIQWIHFSLLHIFTFTTFKCIVIQVSGERLPRLPQELEELKRISTVTLLFLSQRVALSFQELFAWPTLEAGVP